jgi:hypothetical protein
VEELIPKVTEAVDVRLKEISKTLIDINNNLVYQKEDCIHSFNDKIGEIKICLEEIGKKVG